MSQTIVAVFAPPASFKDGNVVFFSAPSLEVDAGLEPVLLEGLQDHTFGIDLCGGDDKNTHKTKKQDHLIKVRLHD